MFLSLSKIQFERFNLCKKIDISQLCLQHLYFSVLYLLKCQFTVFHLPLNGICLQIEVDPNSNGNPFSAEVSRRQRAKCQLQTFSLSPEPPSKPSLISFLSLKLRKTKLMLSTEGNVTTPLSCYKKPDFQSSSILGELDYCSLAKCHLQTFSLSPHQPKKNSYNFQKKNTSLQSTKYFIQRKQLLPPIKKA